MKQIILLVTFVAAFLFAHSQDCVTQDLDTRSPELIDRIEHELDEGSYSSSRSVTQIQTVVHVLWNSPNENLSDSIVQANIDLVNKDLRRQNADTSETPNHFLPVAVDTEIELRLAQVDPNGQPTNGITHTYTDSAEFHIDFGHMKYDSTGGKAAWDTESYLNVWVVGKIESGPIGVVLGHTSLTGSLEQSEVGITIRTIQFIANHGWRTLTHEFGHFACLLHPEANGSCYDADLVFDTPIAQIQPILPQICGDTITSCGNGPNGNMYMNYMSYSSGDCMNIYTQGQKSRMLNCIETQFPGLTDYQFLDVEDVGLKNLEVYPNPTQTQLHFQSSEKSNVSVLDLSGRTVITSVASKGKNTIDVESLPGGIYLLRLESGQTVSSARFVKN